METRTDHCFVVDFVSSLHRALDSPSTKMSGRNRGPTVEPASTAFYGVCCVRDPGDLATSRSNLNGKAGRAETSGVRLRTVCDPANSGSNAVHME